MGSIQRLESLVKLGRINSENRMKRFVPNEYNDTRFSEYERRWVSLCEDLVLKGIITSFKIKYNSPDDIPMVYLVRGGSLSDMAVPLQMHQEVTIMDNNILKACTIKKRETENSKGGFKWLYGSELETMIKQGKI